MLCSSGFAHIFLSPNIILILPLFVGGGIAGQGGVGAESPEGVEGGRGASR